MAIINLMPPEAKKLLMSHYGRPSDQPLWDWASETAEKLIEQCQNVIQATYQGQPFGAPRAYCPLCGDGSSSFYEEGFALPTGLMRHLTGYGNMRQCEVFRAALALAKGNQR
ncbi:hypothetical protein [Lysobacter panacisoli]|nr:hypothetical protein [Lysobacter panacisoli]